MSQNQTQFKGTGIDLLYKMKSYMPDPSSTTKLTDWWEFDNNALKLLNNLDTISRIAELELLLPDVLDSELRFKVEQRIHILNQFITEVLPPIAKREVIERQFPEIKVFPQLARHHCMETKGCGAVCHVSWCPESEAYQEPQEAVKAWNLLVTVFWHSVMFFIGALVATKLF